MDQVEISNYQGLKNNDSLKEMEVISRWFWSYSFEHDISG